MGGLNISRGPIVSKKPWEAGLQLDLATVSPSYTPGCPPWLCAGSALSSQEKEFSTLDRARSGPPPGTSGALLRPTSAIPSAKPLLLPYPDSVSSVSSQGNGRSLLSLQMCLDHVFCSYVPLLL